MDSARDPAGVFRYDLFFSYRHKPLDSEITRRMFERVESFRMPAALRREGCREVTRAFRDTEELSVSRVLTETIDDALRASRCLVVVCSADTPSSEWVDREIAVFIECGRADRIYPLLITGDPETSFPPSLRKVPDIGSRIMDARAEDGSRRGIASAADGAILKAIAAAAGCGEEELRREDALRSRKSLRRRAAVAAAVLATVTGISGALMHLARSYRDEAARGAEASIRLLRELTYDLPDHLTNVPGAYARIADILEENTEDLNDVLLLSGDRPDTRMEIGANYEKLANARSVLGMYQEALEAQDRALEIYRVLAQEETETDAEVSPQTGAALASAWNNRGAILHRAGDLAAAAGSYEEASRLAPAEDTVLRARILLNAGANAVDAGDADAARQLFADSLDVLGIPAEGAPAEADRDPDTYSEEVLLTAALVLRNDGVLQYRRGSYAEAEQKLESACELCAQLLDRSDSLQNRGEYLAAVSALAACVTEEGAYERAERYYLQAIGIAQVLAEDGENIPYNRLLAELCNNLGLCRNMRGAYADADEAYREAVNKREEISAKTGAAADRGALAQALLNTGENAFKMQAYAESEALFAEGLRVYEEAAEELGPFDLAQYHAWRSYDLLLFARDPEGAVREARTACELQPDGVLPHLNLAYACLYSGNYEECDTLMRILASLGDGQRATIRRDLEAQALAGLTDPHTETILKILEE